MLIRLVEKASKQKRLTANRGLDALDTTSSQGELVTKAKPPPTA